MPLSILMFLALPLAAAPLLTFRIYEDAYRNERARIVLDNAAILLGRNDRTLWNELEASNRSQLLFDSAHHAVHFCDLPHCKAADIVAHAAMERSQRMLSARIQASWLAGRAVASTVLSKTSETRHSNLRRVPLAPVRERRCPICRNPIGWEPERDRMSTQIVIAGARLEPMNATVSFSKSVTWQYRLQSDR